MIELFARSSGMREAVALAELVSRTDSNAECARMLGISRKNLYEKIARYELN